MVGIQSPKKNSEEADDDGKEEMAILHDWAASKAFFPVAGTTIRSRYDKFFALFSQEPDAPSEGSTLVNDEVWEEVRWHQLIACYKELNKATVETPSGGFVNHDEALKLLQNAGFDMDLGRGALNWIVREKISSLKAYMDEAKAAANSKEEQAAVEEELAQLR